VAALLARNAGCDPRRLRWGRCCAFPDRPSRPACAVRSQGGRHHPARRRSAGNTPCGGPGDTPAGIAVRYGIGLADLDRANPGLDPKNLPVGKVLVIPETVPDAPPPVTVTRAGQPEGRAAPLVMDFR
jgi:hypothetical protein